MYFLILLMCLMGSKSAASSNISDIWRNNRAAKHMGQEKMLEAHEEFTQLLSEKPFHPLFQFNLGASFIGVEEIHKAIQMYHEVLQLDPLPPMVEFATYYNLGFLHSLEGGDVDKALENYQNALAMQPASKEIKTNIELLMQAQQGGGKGDGEDQSEDQEQKDEGEQPKEPQKFTNKKQPDQFDQKEMSKSDVKKILEELKKQEQKIRSKHDRKGGREADRDKNW